MFKKLSRIAIVVAALSLIFSGTARADEGQPPEAQAGDIRWGGGEITAVGADNFTIRTRRGNEQVIYVDGGTTLADRELKPLSLGDLQVGYRVLGAAKLGDDRQWHGLVIYVFAAATPYKGVGTVDAVQADSFDFTNRRGKQWEFYVDSNTKFYEGRGDTPLSFGEVVVGARVFVQAEKRSDGEWWATEVRLLPANAPGQRPVSAGGSDS